VQLQHLYKQPSTARGDRCLIVTIAPQGKHRVWVVAPFGTLADGEEEFVTAVQQQVPVPGGIREPIMFAITYWLGPDGAAPPQRAGPPPVTMPDELAVLRRAGTIDELLQDFWVSE
jgi:hypothetical protein